jgi:hypothetical protein
MCLCEHCLPTSHRQPVVTRHGLERSYSEHTECQPLRFESGPARKRSLRRGAGKMRAVANPCAFVNGCEPVAYWASIAHAPYAVPDDRRRPERAAARFAPGLAGRLLEHPKLARAPSPAGCPIRANGGTSRSSSNWRSVGAESRRRHRPKPPAPGNGSRSHSAATGQAAGAEVDLEAAGCWVRHRLRRVGGACSLVGPQSQSSRLPVPITPAAMEAVEAERAAAGRQPRSGPALTHGLATARAHPADTPAVASSPACPCRTAPRRRERSRARLGPARVLLGRAPSPDRCGRGPESAASGRRQAGPAPRAGRLTAHHEGYAGSLPSGGCAARGHGPLAELKNPARPRSSGDRAAVS